MARTILSRFYSNILRNKANAQAEFVEAAKALAAFFTLWRSAQSNSGLPEVYKDILRGHKDRGYAALAWSGNDSDFTSANLKTYLRTELLRKVKSKSEWKAKVPINLRYDRARNVCKFALLVAAQNMIPDDLHPGLMKLSSREDELHLYLTPRMWASETTKTVEHIAPQTHSLGWDISLYENEAFHEIGNLTLLPEDLNQLLGNHTWRTKWVYFKYITLKQSVEIDVIEKEYGIKLNRSALKVLDKTKYIEHITPIITVDINGQWDHNIVKARTGRVADILWETLFGWLN